MRSFPVWEEPPRTTGRIYVAGTNLFTISKLNKYKLDPEAPSGAGTRYYPLMRTFTIGLNISL